MRYDAILLPELVEQLDRLGRADIVVGIPSYNNARTIGHVVRAVTAGLAKYFPGARAVLVNSDGSLTMALYHHRYHFQIHSGDDLLHHLLYLVNTAPQQLQLLFKQQEQKCAERNQEGGHL